MWFARQIGRSVTSLPALVRALFRLLDECLSPPAGPARGERPAYPYPAPAAEPRIWAIGAMSYTSIVCTAIEYQTLEQLLEPAMRSLNDESARKLAALRLDAKTQARIDALAERCNEGALSPEERAEYEAYVRAIDLIGILQAGARATLTAPAPS